MKKVKILLAIVLALTALYFCSRAYSEYKDNQVFVKLTSISKFELVSDVREAQYFYVIANISPVDKKMMLKQHYFRPAPINLKGNIDHNLHFINESDYLYYLEDNGHGYLGYVLYLVSKIDNKVIVYTSYAD